MVFHLVAFDGYWTGELLMTNIQMANLAAIIANCGYYYTPHFVNEIKDVEGNVIEKRSFEKHEVGVEKQYFEPVVEGMQKAVMGEPPSTLSSGIFPSAGKQEQPKIPREVVRITLFFCFCTQR